MVFRGDYYPNATSAPAESHLDDDSGGENMYRDVKDFNWLRTLVASPNFVVVANGGKDEDGMKPQLCTEDDVVGATCRSNGLCDDEETHDQEREQEGSSEDEDEL